LLLLEPLCPYLYIEQTLTGGGSATMSAKHASKRAWIHLYHLFYIENVISFLLLYHLFYTFYFLYHLFYIEISLKKLHVWYVKVKMFNGTYRDLSLAESRLPRLGSEKNW
jgi:hypothetical protein